MESIIIDVGTFSTKCGVSGESEPRAVFQTIIGKPKVLEDGDKSCYIGDEVKSYFEEKTLQVKRPIKCGKTVDMESLETLFHHTFYNELRVGPEEQPVLLLENYNEDNRKKKIEIMFESCQVPSLFLGTSSLFGFANFGVENGVLIDSGYETTHIFFKSQDTITKVESFDVGGFNVLSKLDGFKDNLSYLHLEKLREKMEKENLGKFEFSLKEQEHQIYLCGGNSVYLDDLFSIEQNKEHRDWIPFQGASQISSMDSFSSFWVEQSEYEEIGSSVIEKFPKINQIN